MNALFQAPSVMIVLLAWLNAPPSGLADIAQRETLRRQATQKSHASLTNLGVPEETVPVAAVTMPPPADTAPPADPGAKPAKPAGDKPTEPVRDEAWWRKKMDDARAAVDRGVKGAQALQTRINQQQADAVNIDDPIKQTQARLNVVKSLEELEKLNKQIEADRKVIADLQDEARRQNVPPGWIR